MTYLYELNKLCGIYFPNKCAYNKTIDLDTMNFLLFYLDFLFCSSISANSKLLIFLFSASSIIILTNLLRSLSSSLLDTFYFYNSYVAHNTKGHFLNIKFSSNPLSYICIFCNYIPLSSYFPIDLSSFKTIIGITTIKIRNISAKNNALFSFFNKNEGIAIPTDKLCYPSGLPNFKHRSFLSLSVKHSYALVSKINF